jgi:hypothetical protein
MYPLICTDCRWFIEDSSATKLHKCKASETIDLVTGERNHKFCITQRMDGGDCGIAGKNFSLNIPDEVAHGN